MSSRVGKKLRFEVFKRDEFTCQYCGAFPPNVVLEVDHVNPVSNGGTNCEENLITSCSDCNRGKGANLLTSAPETIKKRFYELKEKEEQIIAYQELLSQIDQRIENEAFKILDVLMLVDSDGAALKTHIISVKNFIKNCGFFDVLDSAHITVSKRIYNDNNRFKYFCGVCWRKININKE